MHLPSVQYDSAEAGIPFQKELVECEPFESSEMLADRKVKRELIFRAPSAPSWDQEPERLSMSIH